MPASIIRKPTKHPDWLVKAEWRSTATRFIVTAPNADLAWDKAWKRVARMEGGDMCLNVKVIRQLN